MTLRRESSGCLQENLIWEKQNKDITTKYEHIRRLGTGEASYSDINLIKIKDDKIGGSAFEKPKKEKGEHGVLHRFSKTRSRNSSICETQSRRSSVNNTLFLLKTVGDDAQDQENIKNEISILKSLDHPNIVKAFEVYYDKNHTHVVMEYCLGGDLQSSCSYSEKRAAEITRDILSALLYMHRHGVIHRNLSLKHAVFASLHENSMVKVISFEKATKFESGEDVAMDCVVGELYSMSPQMLTKNYNSQTDLWSVGVILFILLSQKMPFYDTKPRYMTHRILKGYYKMKGSVWENVSDGAKDLVRSLLEVDPEKRLTAANALNHKWLKDNDLSDKVSSDMTKAIGERIREYLKTPDIKKIALNIVAQRSSPDEMVRLRGIFATYDTNRDGVISFDEFNDAMKEYNQPPETIRALFNSIDINNQGTIGFTEFLAATVEEYGFMEEERIAEAFDRMDFKNTGYIKRSELGVIVGDSYSKEKVDSIMKEIDTDNDGRIYYDEFLHLFRLQMTKMNLEMRSLLDNSAHEDDESTTSEDTY